MSTPTTTTRRPRRRPRLLVTALAVVGVLAGPLVLTPTSEAEARWFVSAEATLPEVRGDSLSLTAQDVTPSATPGTSPNTPATRVTAGASRQTGLIDVVSTRVSLPSGSPGSDALLANSSVRYGLATTGGSCAGSTAAYWTVGGAGQVAPGTRYTRSGAVPGTATLASGAAREVCPQIVPSRTGNALSLNHAGRVLDVQTESRLITQAPASLSSTPTTVTSRYRVGFPDVDGRNGGSDICLPNGQISGEMRDGGLLWQWPAASVPHGTATPAVWAWGIRIRPTTSSTWTEFALDDTTRRIPQSAASMLPTRQQQVIAVRAYPFPGDTSRYVESVHTRVTKISSRQWNCNGVLNGTGGPVNMP